MNVNDKLIAVIRTGVPAAVGALIAWLIGKVPVVADVIAYVDALLTEAGFAGVTVLALLQAVVLGLVIAAYYWAARTVAARFPVLERWLLGSSIVPDYTSGAEIFVLKSDLAKERSEVERLRAIADGGLELGPGSQL